MYQPESKILQVANFLIQCDDLRQEVDFELQYGAGFTGARAHGLDGEDPARHAEVALLHLARPVVEHLLGVQLEPEAVPVRFQLLTLDVVLPAFAWFGKFVEVSWRYL